MASDAAPARAFVRTRPHLATGGAEVQPDWVALVGGHGLAQHGEPRLALRKAAIEPRKGLAAVARHVDGRLALGADAWPDRGAVHRKRPHGFGVARMDDDGEADVADLSGHVVADAHPTLFGAAHAVQAAMVLLVEQTGIERRHGGPGSL